MAEHFIGFVLALVAVLQVGFNWTPSNNDTPQQTMTRIGGSVYRTYGDPFIGPEGPERLRLVRYDRNQPQIICDKSPQFQAHGRCPSWITQAVALLPGRQWQLGNEPNLDAQDGGLRNPQEAPAFANWFRTIRAAIKVGDPTAIIVGPGVANWDGAGIPEITSGRDAYIWFTQQPDTQYDYLAVQVYPWNDYLDPAGVGLTVATRQVRDAVAWSSKPVMVTEWGLARRGYNCALLPQSDNDRRSFVFGMLNEMQARGVRAAYYFGSHDQPCAANGYMGWLVNLDGTLTVDGAAHLNRPIPYQTAK